MKEYQKHTIQAIISEINRTIFLPDIQRPFVWNENQIYKLFDSLLREYPISTMLFWQLSKDNLEKIESTDNTKIKIYKFVSDNDTDYTEELNRERDNYSLVLDGQQRLTSLYIALKGSWIWYFRKKRFVAELYFNVLSGKDENDDGIIYEFEFKDKNIGIALFEKVKHEEKEIPKIWVNVKRIYESEIGKAAKRKEFVKQINDFLKLDDTYTNSIDDNIDSIDNVLKQDGIINYYPETEIDYERVLDIFVRTNSGGTKLGYSDLLFSKIKLNWGEARDKFDEVINKICINNFEFDNDFLLKCCLLLYSKKTDDIKYKTTNLNSIFITNIIKDWDSKISQSIYVTMDLLNLFFIKDKKLLPSYNALIPIFYWIAIKNKKGFKTDNDSDVKEIKEIRKWLIKALLSGAFGGQSDNILSKCKEAIDKSTSSIFPGKEIQDNIETIKSRRMSIESEQIDKIKYGSKESHLLLSLCYAHNNNYNPLFYGNFPEQDHIFCKHELKLAGVSEELINSIYNIRLVSQNDNRTKSNIPFIDWSNSLGANKNSVFDIHLIPKTKVWTVSNYVEFLEARKQEMIKKIN